MPTYFGNTPAGNITPSANFVYFFPATCNATGNVTDGRFTSVSGSGNGRLAVYADSAGVPGALLGMSTTVAASGSAVQNVTYPTPFAVTNGVQYWLTWLFDTGFSVGGTASGPWHFQAATYPNYPSPATPSALQSGITGNIEAGVTVGGSVFVPMIAIL